MSQPSIVDGLCFLGGLVFLIALGVAGGIWLAAEVLGVGVVSVTVNMRRKETP